MGLKERVQSLCKKKGVTAQQAEKDLNFAKGSISKLNNNFPTSAKIQKMSDYFGVTVDYLLGRDTAYPLPSSDDGVWIPVLGRVAAGIPIEAIEYIEDYEEIPRDMVKNGEYFALRVQGDSMMPRINSGDVVIVRKQADCDNGDIAVVVVNGDEATVKRIKKGPEGLMLIPNNQAYEPMYYSNRDIETLPVRILGKVVELRAKF